MARTTIIQQYQVPGHEVVQGHGNGKAVSLAKKSATTRLSEIRIVLKRRRKYNWKCHLERVQESQVSKIWIKLLGLRQIKVLFGNYNRERL